MIGMDITGKNKNKGFTIVEVMVAFLILAFGFIGMIYMATFTIKANSMGRGIGQARFIAEQQAEFLRSLDYRNPLLIDDGDTLDLDDLLTPDFLDTTITEETTYQIAWNIAENIPIAGMKTLKIHVSWESLSQQNHYEISTLKGEVRR